MLANGFENKRRDDYENVNPGLILEDLHDENVLTRKVSYILLIRYSLSSVYLFIG